MDPLLDPLHGDNERYSPTFEPSYILPGNNLTWNNISAVGAEKKVTQSSWKDMFTRTKPKKVKQILHNVSGIAEAGRLLAIMGSSGAGKTTLLNVLTLRNLSTLDVQGEVVLDGKRANKWKLREVSAFVQQHDMFVGTLTVREHLQFMARLRMGPNYTKAEREARVEEVMHRMGLSKCANTMIGIPHQILTCPSILFCDEPTSGLDAFMAGHVVQALRSLADAGMTVVITIHQPSSQVYSLFNDVCLMACGRTVYLGEADKAVDHFAECGFPCPAFFNAADHLIRTIAVTNDRQRTECLRKVAAIREGFQKSPAGKRIADLCKAVKGGPPSSFGKSESKSLFSEHSWTTSQKYSASFLAQFWALFWRAWLTVTRDPILFKVRIAQTLITALITGIVYWQTPINKMTVMTINGILFNHIRNLNFMLQFPAVPAITTELPIVLRENANGVYKTSAYFLAKNLAEVPQYCLMPTIYISMVYWMSGLEPYILSFLFSILISILVVGVAISVSYAVATVFGDTAIAMTFLPIFVVPTMAFGGFFINYEDIPWYFQWLASLSYFKYGYEGLAINEWDTVNYIPGCNVTTPYDYDCPATGQEVLASVSFDSINRWRDVLILFAEILYQYANWLDCTYLIVGTILAFIIGALQPTVTLLGGILENILIKSTEPVGDTQFRTDAYKVVYWYVVAGVVVSILSLAQVILTQRGCSGIVSRLRIAFLDSVLHQDAIWLDNNDAGALAANLGEHIEKVREGLGEKWGLVIRGVSMFMASVGISLAYDWRTTLIMFGLVPASAITMYFSAKSPSPQFIKGKNGSSSDFLLAGVYEPNSGRIFADGHDLTTLDITSLRKHLGIVSQEPPLFSDEATSALDTQSEAYVQKALEATKANRTTISIAHRLSTTRNSDVIFVFDKGRIVEKGTHIELLALDGLYAGLARAQKLTGANDGNKTKKTFKSVAKACTNLIHVSKMFTTEKPEDRAREKSPECPSLLVRNTPEDGAMRASFRNHFGRMMSPSVVSDLAASFGQEIKMKNVLSARVADACVNALREKVLTKTLLRDGRYFDKEETSASACIGTLSQQPESCKAALDARSNVFTSNFTGLMGILSVCVCIVLMIGLFGFTYAVERKMKHRIIADTTSQLALEAITHTRQIQLLSSENFFLGRYERKQQEVAKLDFLVAVFQAATQALTQGFVFFCEAAAFALGIWLVFEGKRTASDIFMGAMCVSFAGWALFFMQPSFNDLSRATAAASSLYALLEGSATDLDEGLQTDLDGSVEAIDLQFAYPSRPEYKVATGLSINATPKESIALVGESGCGKSTIIQLIERFYSPHAGTLKIGGHQADLGYETELGERGKGLSGGQKQRIAIARALIRKPKILLLDEATSALDTQSEQIVQEALAKVGAARTTISIAHRLSTIQNCNRIYYIEHGKVQDAGSHAELLQKNEKYAKMVQMQTLTR
ncbi:unnamed protein product, partial [Mesorhabditis spiculigera]